jgi:hypothetical protein
MSTTDQQQPADNPNEATCTCNRNMAVQIMCGLGLTSCILVVLSAVLSLMQLEGGVAGFIINVYLCFLGLIAFIAELRIFRVLRGMIFYVIKYVYFLTSCVGRGVFYFVIGSVSFQESNTVSWIACGVTCATGLLLIGLDCKFKFPVYIDPQIAKLQAEARLKWERDEAQRKLTDAAAATPRVGLPGPLDQQTRSSVSMNTVAGDASPFSGGQQGYGNGTYGGQQGGYGGGGQDQYQYQPPSI